MNGTNTTTPPLPPTTPNGSASCQGAGNPPHAHAHSPVAYGGKPDTERWLPHSLLPTPHVS